MVLLCMELPTAVVHVELIPYAEANKTSVQCNLVGAQV